MNFIITFDNLYSLSPNSIRELLDQCKHTQQSVNWHPEGNVFIHTRIVYNRARNLNDWDKCIAALFHDLGKVLVTKPGKNPGSWSAYGHELASIQILERHKDWVEKIGANYEKVHAMVFNHMRVKLMDEMKPKKQQEMKDHPLFKDIFNFSELDNMQNLTYEELSWIY